MPCAIKPRLQKLSIVTVYMTNLVLIATTMSQVRGTEVYPTDASDRVDVAQRMQKRPPSFHTGREINFGFVVQGGEVSDARRC